MDVFTHPWIMFAPFMVAFGPISVAVVKALRGQFGRKPRHRGVYEFWDHNVDTQPSLAIHLPVGLAPQTLTNKSFIWDGGTYGVAPELLNAGEPPAALTFKDLERFGQQMSDQQTRERIAEITRVVNGVLAQHERVYHPIPA
jgi:hypothetical protein